MAKSKKKKQKKKPQKIVAGNVSLGKRKMKVRQRDVETYLGETSGENTVIAGNVQGKNGNMKIDSKRCKIEIGESPKNKKRSKSKERDDAHTSSSNASSSTKLGGSSSCRNLTIKVDLGEKQIAYTTQRLELVKSIKKQVEKEIGHKNFVLLNSEGQELDEEKSLRDAGLSDGCVVKMREIIITSVAPSSTSSKCI